MQKRRLKILIFLTGICGLLFFSLTMAFGRTSTIWPSIADHFDLPSDTNHASVRREIYWLVHNPQNFEALTENARPYIYYIYTQTQKKHLPAELALLPMLESNYKPFTYSPVGAVGLWQLMPGTAEGEGIQINWWYDGRRDTIASTDVALNYLTYLHKFFNGNWLLAIASYDAGAGTVLNAIHYNEARHLPTDFWSLPLPKETRRYVPKLIAIADILRHPSHYNVELPSVPNAPIVNTVAIHKQMNLSVVAKDAGISLSEVEMLNPGFRRFATPPHKTTILVLPINHIEAFLKKIKIYTADKATQWIHYTVQPGDTLITIAKKFKTSTTALKLANNLKNHVIRVFHPLLIPKASKKVTKAINGKISKRVISEDHLPGPKRFTYTATANDSLWKIAKKYHLKIAELRYWNNLSPRTMIHKGEKLIIWKGHHHAYNPGYHAYTVEPDDNLSMIAYKNHTSTTRLKTLNHLHSDILNIGQVLTVPNS